jgi:hypothetical protein
VALVRHPFHKSRRLLVARGDSQRKGKLIRVRSIYRLLVPVLLCLAWLAALQAQLSNATIKGTVTDPAGAVVVKANVNLTNVDTGEHWTQQTSGQGNYDFTALAPGRYKLFLALPGFAEWAGGLTLRVAQDAEINPHLVTGTVATTIDVRDVTPVIDTTDSTLSDVKEYARIESLPLQKRNLLNNLNFSPGVVANGFGGQGGGYTRVNGIPGGSMDYLVDGQTASERYTNELQRLPQPLPTIQELKVTTANGDAEYSRPGMVEVVTKSGTNDFHGELFELNQNNALEAKSFHQQFVNFLVHNEFGGNLGGPVWIPKIYNGKNKTFFFVDAEAIRQRSVAEEQEVLPLPAWKAGDFSTYTDSQGAPVTIYDPATTRLDPASGTYVRTPFAGNVIPKDRINPIAAKVIGYLPDPNLNTPFYLGPNWQNPNGRAVDDNTLITAKVDQLFGANRLSARYTYTDKNNFGPKYLLNPDDRLYGGNNGAISFTESVSPSVVNEIRAGVQQFHAFRGPQAITPPITQTLGLPTYPGTIAWPSFYFDDAYNFSFSGIDRDNPQDAPGVTISLGDNLSWTRGKHEIKLGFFFQNSQVNTYETGQPGGDYNFSGNFTGLMDPASAQQGIFNQSVVDTGAGLADFLLGNVDAADLNVVPKFYTRQSDYAGYVQDNWRITQNLTLNLGVRYEYWTPFSDKRNQISTLNLNAPGGPAVVYAGSGSITTSGLSPAVVAGYQAAGLNLQSAQQAGFPSSLWNMPKNNWAPRLGFAYQIDSKSVLRGGYGIYYWAMPLVQYQQNTRHNVPFSYSYFNQTDNNDAAAAELAFPAGAGAYANQSPDARTIGADFINPSALNIAQNGGWNILPWDTNYKNQEAQEWNVSLERQLPWRLGARVSYVGTHSSNLVEYDPINVPVPRLLAPGLTPVQRRPYPNYAASSTGAMDLMRFNGYANSNQLQTELKRNYQNGLVLQGFFTWQKTLTTSEGSNNSFGGLEMLPASLTNNASVSQRLRAIYAPDSELPTYTLSFNGNYELPFGEGKRFLSGSNGVVKRLVGGWNVSAFQYWRSGLPFSPYYSVRGSNITLAPGKNGVLPASQRQAAGWFDPSIDRADLGQPYTGQTFIQVNPLQGDFLNNIPRNYMTGPGFYDVDASFYKLTTIKERVRLRIEAQIFNLLNHKNFGLPNNQGVISTGVGGAPGTSGAPARTVQFQGKIEF